MRNEVFVKTFTATTDIEPYRVVALGAADGVVIQSDGHAKANIGTSNIIGADTDAMRCDVVLSGIAEVEYGGEVTRGAWLTADADGKAIATTTAGHNVIGRALISGVAGDIGSVFLTNGVA